MITLKTFERTPSLAELKVTYRRDRPKDDRQKKKPRVLCTPVACEEYLRTIWDKDTIDLREEFIVVCLNASNEVLGWVKLHTGGLEDRAGRFPARVRRGPSDGELQSSSPTTTRPGI